MILDRLDRLSAYQLLHPAIPQVLAYVAEHSLEQLPDGRTELDGDRLFVLVATDPGRGTAGAVLEAHRRYIDIQVVIRGQERIGWSPLSACRQLRAPYDPERDIEFYNDLAEAWIDLGPQQFALFLPADAHAPLAATGTIRKAVFKLAEKWL